MIDRWMCEIHNAGEPINYVTCIGTVDSDIPSKMFGSLLFRDGEVNISIEKLENGTFQWINDKKIGIAVSFNEALKQMPALLTDCDYSVCRSIE